MWITKTSINYPVFATMVMVGLMVLGLFSYKNLGVEENPDVHYPNLTISVSYPTASPEAVENEITRPIEDVVNTISGVKTITSSSYEGRSVSWISFDLKTDMVLAIQELRDKIAQVRPTFPKLAKDPSISRWEENVDPISEISISSTTRSLRELSTLTEQVIVKRLQNVAGVGQIVTGGKTVRQIEIILKPAQLAAYNIGVDEVLGAIQNANQDMSSGIISDGADEKLIRIEGRIKDPQAFGKIIVARRANSPVFLAQLVEVTDGEREEQSIARIDGRSAITVAVTKIQDANIVEVGNGLKKAVDELKKRLPADIRLSIQYSKSDAVQKQMDNVKEMIVEGAALTILIVFLFLHSWRSTIITGLTLPISVMATFIAMRALNFTINGMTMMALSLCIGLLIDDAIVVRENIVRHLAMGKNHYDAANDGTNEIGLAVMATTFAIVAVFVPVAFMNGMMGRYFLPFGITVTVAVLVSLFVSFTLDPMLSSVWRDPSEGRFRKVPWMGHLMLGIDRGLDWVHVQYGRILNTSLQWRKSVLGLALALFAGSFFLLPLIGTEMMPQVDYGFISLTFKTRVGSSLRYTDAKIRQVEEALKNFPEIESVIATVGGEDGSNTATVNLKLTDLKISHRRSQDQVEASIRERLKPIAGIELSVGSDKPVRVEILGQDPEKLEATAQQVIKKVSAIKGIVDLEYSQTAATPSINLKINRELASDLGLSLPQIGTALSAFIAGDAFNHWLAPDGQNYEVNVQLPKSGRQKIADLTDLSLASTKLTADGQPIMVPLRQVVEFVPSFSPHVIGREALQRRVGIYANVQGRPTGAVFADVQAMVKNFPLPPGVSFSIVGGAEDMQNMQSSAFSALGIAVIFIYLVLASQFGSFLQPIAIMMSLPLSLIGVLLALLVTGSTLNMFSGIGFIMLMGLVTKNAILLVDFTNQSQRQGMAQHEALLAAGKMRLRPILMTTLAMIFGMLPMAIGFGDGGEMQAPMGRAVIGGIITSTLLTLIVVPVAYTYLDTWGKRAAAYLKASSDDQAVAVH
jgi:HAE1 family hydrophobic/amphiphilic exporter-1